MRLRPFETNACLKTGHFNKLTGHFTAAFEATKMYISNQNRNLNLVFVSKSEQTIYTEMSSLDVKEETWRSNIFMVCRNI